MKRLFKFIFILIGILVLLVVGLLIFIKLYKPFGGTPNSKDQKEYAKISKNFNNGTFYNIDKIERKTNWEDIYRLRTSGKGKLPTDEIPIKEYEYSEPEKEDDVLITWFGHSSVLIQMHNLTILVDPVFDEVVSPFSFKGIKRYSKIPVDIDKLPDIDVILLTHDHYDHESYNTLKKLDNKTARYIVPLGIEKDLEKFGIKKSKITKLAWWQEEEIDGLTIACTPARHFAGRYILDSDETLWSSWILKDEYNTIFDSGDTSYGSHFESIKEKYGKISFALLDGAQYNTSWHDVHMFPEESVDAAIDLDAQVSMVIHNSAYALSNHPWDDPLRRFVISADEKNKEYTTPMIGETINIKDYKKYQTKWWEDIK